MKKLFFLFPLFLYSCTVIHAGGQTLPSTTQLAVVWEDWTAKANAIPAHGTLQLPSGGHVILDNVELHRADVHILGDPKAHTQVTCKHTAITAYPDCSLPEVAYIDFVGSATFFMGKCKGPNVHDCVWMSGCWEGAKFAAPASAIRVENCGGTTHEYGTYFDTGVDDALVYRCYGDSTDQHPTRCSGGTNIAWVACEYSSRGNKECMALRKGDRLVVLRCKPHGPVLWGEGAGNGVPKNVTNSMMRDCVLDWNQMVPRGIGCQTEARAGADVVFIDNTFIVTDARQQPADVGANSVVDFRGNHVTTPDGKLAKAHWVTNRGTIVGDDTVLEKIK